MFDVLPLTPSTFADDFEAQTLSQHDYLWDYLTDLGAKAFIREADYVDRHYLDDYARYYSRSFRAPAPHCRRLHYFEVLDERRHDELIGDAYGADAKARGAARELLAQHYLGFVVRRPLATARIGRTVLRTYPDAGR